MYAARTAAVKGSCVAVDGKSHAGVPWLPSQVRGPGVFQIGPRAACGLAPWLPRGRGRGFGDRRSSARASEIVRYPERRGSLLSPPPAADGTRGRTGSEDGPLSGLSRAGIAGTIQEGVPRPAQGPRQRPCAVLGLLQRSMPAGRRPFASSLTRCAVRGMPGRNSIWLPPLGAQLPVTLTGRGGGSARAPRLHSNQQEGVPRSSAARPPRELL